LAIIRLNRDQNHLELLLADTRTGQTHVVFDERQENGWIPIFDDFRFLKNRIQMVWTSRRDGWKHAYLVDLATGQFLQITRGDWDVTRVVGVDEKRQRLFYLSTEVSPLERQLFVIKFDARANAGLPGPREPTPCRYRRISAILSIPTPTSIMPRP